MVLYNIKDLSVLIRKHSDVLTVLFFTTETRPPVSPSCRLYEQEAIGPTPRWEGTENFYLFAHWEAAMGKKPLPSVIKAQLFRSTNFSISAAIESGALNIAPLKKAASFDTAFQRGRCDRKRKPFQKDIAFWNLAWAINCDLPQSLTLMTFFPDENPRLKNLVKTILRYYINILKDTFC